MEVKEVMTGEAASCTPKTSLAAAAMLMWERDCGVLPVVDDARKVVGVITDRDICMAAAMRPRPASEISVGEVISGAVHACAPADDVHEALRAMRQEKVHRLPVVGPEGELQGIVSLNDVILAAEPGGGGQKPDLSYADVVETYKAVCEHRTPPQGQAQTSRQSATTA